MTDHDNSDIEHLVSLYRDGDEPEALLGALRKAASRKATTLASPDLSRRWVDLAAALSETEVRLDRRQQPSNATYQEPRPHTTPQEPEDAVKQSGQSQSQEAQVAEPARQRAPMKKHTKTKRWRKLEKTLDAHMDALCQESFGIPWEKAQEIVRDKRMLVLLKEAGTHSSARP